MTASRIIFLGPPGTGKGTQAGRMSQRFGLAALSSGEILRNEILSGSEVGKRAAEFVHAGLLVPDDLIIRMMLSVIGGLGEKPGFILDGFPRTQPQATALDKGLDEVHRPVQLVFDFRIDDSVIVERIVSRRICSKCQATYNVRFFPPKEAGVCDRCGGLVGQRADDQESVIRTRLETYRRQTATLVPYYEAAGNLRAIDASRPAQTIETEVADLIAAHKGE